VNESKTALHVSPSPTRLSRRDSGLSDCTGDSTFDEFTDDFSAALPRGRVIGSQIAGGISRKGIDRESSIQIDNGALRIQPLVRPGWGRAGIAYGPYARVSGLAFGVSILNGHNTSQTGSLPDTVRERIHRWALGSGTEGLLRRLTRWAFSRQRAYMWHHLLQWSITGSPYFQGTAINENLAIGWFPREVPGDPVSEGNAVLMHALGPECGELWVRVGDRTLPSVRGVQNIQMYYLVILRDQGAAYYVASVPGVPGIEQYPTLTPIAIDPFNADPLVYAGLHQSVLGQIGFRVDTRVYRTQVARLPDYGDWFGSASGADRLTGEGPLGMCRDTATGAWTVYDGILERTSRGLRAVQAPSSAVLELPSPPGLVHFIVETTDDPVQEVALLFRVLDRDNFCAFEVGTRQCSLLVRKNGQLTRFPASNTLSLSLNRANSVQVCDDGKTVRLSLNGEQLLGIKESDACLSNGCGAGLQYGSGTTNTIIRDFEAHSRRVPVPRPINLGQPWCVHGSRVALHDDFEGLPGDLADRALSSGSHAWRREIGRGRIEVTGDGAAKVRATVLEPCPGRTAYTLPWDNTRFADVSVQITPPGTQKGEKERGRGGLIFWQDPDNYLIVSLWMNDSYGMSISSFFQRDGFEELYDAVWTNIGERVHWGVPFVLRVVFDARQYTASINGEPVLYRALSDVYPDWDELLVNRIGIVANWEWGADTGTIFRDFVGKEIT
jgi:hypothetical protein